MSWDIIGHDWAVHLLKGHLTNNRLQHAYLFTGVKGIGKHALALGFIKALHCLDPPQAGEFCNECRPCQLIAQNSFPDLHVVSTEENERAIKVEQIRTLRRSLSLSPNMGNRRIALLLDFHTATEHSANALLKTLEEPPPRVVIILTADSKELLLPTIVSRCESLSLRSVALEELMDFFVSQGESEEFAGLLAGMAGGRPGWAITARNNPAMLERRKKLLDELCELIGADDQERFKYIETWNNSLRKKFPTLNDRRKECLDTLELWLGYWRDLLLVAYGVMEPRSNPDRKTEIQAYASGIRKEHILSAIEAIHRTIGAIDRNANIRLSLETLMLDLPCVEQEPTR